MAQQFPIITVPLVAQFRTNPCHWVKRKDTTRRVLVNGVYQHPIRLVEVGDSIVDAQNYDVWSVRDSFLAIKTEQELVAFLDKTGYFTNRIRGQWDWPRFQRWQEIMRVLLTKHPSQWKAWSANLGHEYRQHLVALLLHPGVKSDFHWKGTAHYAVLTAEDTLTALLLSVYIDHLREAQYRFCARTDCKKAYELTSKHERKYCSQYCAHLESVRRLRAKRRQRKGRNGQ